MVIIYINYILHVAEYNNTRNLILEYLFNAKNN